MAKITSVKTSADNNKLFTAQVNDDNTREFKEYDITSGINNKTLQETADVTSFDEGMDVITVNPTGDKFVGVDRRGRDVINLSTTNNFSINTFNLLSSFKVDRLVRAGFFENIPGGLDTSFNNIPFNDFLFPIIKTNDSIFIGGFFTTPKTYLVRLSIDGEFDSTYTPPNQVDNYVWSLTSFNDKIYVGISPNSASPGKVIRLNSDGSYDSSFNVINTPRRALQMAVNGEGHLIISGGFKSGYILKYDTNGVQLPFSPPSFNLEVDRFLILSNDDIICSGRFTSPTNRLCKIDKNGILISSFNIINTNDWNNTIKYNTYDNMIYFTGRFTSPKNRIIRMDINGNIDNTFNPPSNINDYGSDILFFNDKIILVGYFTSPKRSIIMLNNDGSLINDFSIPVNNDAYYGLINGSTLFINGLFTSPKNRFLKYNLQSESNFILTAEIPFETIGVTPDRLIKLNTSNNTSTASNDFNAITISDGTNEVTILPSQVNTEVNIDTLIGRNLTVTYDLTGNKDINTVLSEYNLTINK